MGCEDNLGCLSGEHIVLEPLSLSHVAALSLAVTDGQLWRLWFTSVPEPTEMKLYVAKALEEKREARVFPLRCGIECQGKSSDAREFATGSLIIAVLRLDTLGMLNVPSALGLILKLNCCY